MNKSTYLQNLEDHYLQEVINGKINVKQMAEILVKASKCENTTQMFYVCLKTVNMWNNFQNTCRNIHNNRELYTYQLNALN